MFDQRQLGAFARFASENKAAMENLLGMEIRSDVLEKPMLQLGAVLGLIGLRLTGAGTVKAAGEKIYRYRLDPGSLQAMRAVVEARDQIKGWSFVSRLHGWPVDEEDDEEDDEEPEDT